MTAKFSLTYFLKGMVHLSGRNFLTRNFLFSKNIYSSSYGLFAH